MKKKQKVQIFKLEERVLFDGAAAAEIVAAVNQAGDQNQADDQSDDSAQDKEEKLIQNTVQNAGPVETPAPEANVQNEGEGLPQTDAAQNDPAEVLINGNADFTQVTDPQAEFSGDIAAFIQDAADPDADAASHELVVIDSEAADQFDADAFEGKNVLFLDGDSDAADQIEDWMNDHSDQDIQEVRLVTDSDTLASQIGDLDVELVTVDAFQAELAGAESSDLVIMPDSETNITVDAAADELPAELTADAAEGRHELVIVNSTTADLDNVLEQLGDSRDVLVIDSTADAFEQISDYLANSDTAYDAVHILTHGNEDGFYIGSQKVVAADPMAVFGGHMAENGDFLLYGCNLAATENGQALIHNIADLTGCDVAASANLTGSEALNADWSLEYSTGSIETIVISLDSTWNNRLATYQVDSTITTPTTTKFKLFKDAFEEAQKTTGNTIEILNPDAQDTGISGQTVSKSMSVRISSSAAAGTDFTWVIGNMEITNNAVLSISGIKLDNGTATINSGTLDLKNGVNNININLQPGTLNVGDGCTVSGTVTATSAAANSIKFVDSDSVISKLVLQSGREWNFSLGQINTLTNHAEVTASENSQIGSLTIGTVTNDGSFTLTRGSVSTLNSTGAAYMNGGTILTANISGGHFTVTAGTISTLSLSNGSTAAVSGYGTSITSLSTVDSTLTISNGTFGTLVSNSSIVTINGGRFTTLNHQSGDISLNAGDVTYFNNYSTGTNSIVSASITSLTNYEGASLTVENGASAEAVVNNGNLTFNGGTVTNTLTNGDTGTVTVAGETKIGFTAGSTTHYGSVYNSGILNLNSTLLVETGSGKTAISNYATGVINFNDGTLKNTYSDPITGNPVGIGISSPDGGVINSTDTNATFSNFYFAVEIPEGVSVAGINDNNTFWALSSVTVTGDSSTGYETIDAALAYIVANPANAYSISINLALSDYSSWEDNLTVKGTYAPIFNLFGISSTTVVNDSIYVNQKVTLATDLQFTSPSSGDGYITLRNITFVVNSGATLTVPDGYTINMTGVFQKVASVSGEFTPFPNAILQSGHTTIINDGTIALNGTINADYTSPTGKIQSVVNNGNLTFDSARFELAVSATIADTPQEIDGIYNSPTGTLTINDSVFSGEVSGYTSTTALLRNATAGTVTVTDSRFTLSAYSGKNSYAVYSDGSLTVTDSFVDASGGASYGLYNGVNGSASFSVTKLPDIDLSLFSGLSSGTAVLNQYLNQIYHIKGNRYSVYNEGIFFTSDSVASGTGYTVENGLLTGTVGAISFRDAPVYGLIGNVQIYAIADAVARADLSDIAVLGSIYSFGTARVDLTNVDLNGNLDNTISEIYIASAFQPSNFAIGDGTSSYKGYYGSYGTYTGISIYNHESTTEGSRKGGAVYFGQKAASMVYFNPELDYAFYNLSGEMLFDYFGGLSSEDHPAQFYNQGVMTIDGTHADGKIDGLYRLYVKEAAESESDYLQIYDHAVADGVSDRGLINVYANFHNVVSIIPNQLTLTGLDIRNTQDAATAVTNYAGNLTINGGKISATYSGLDNMELHYTTGSSSSLNFYVITGFANLNAVEKIAGAAYSVRNNTSLTITGTKTQDTLFTNALDFSTNYTGGYTAVVNSAISIGVWERDYSDTGVKTDVHYIWNSAFSSGSWTGSPGSESTILPNSHLYRMTAASTTDQTEITLTLAGSYANSAAKYTDYYYNPVILFKAETALDYVSFRANSTPATNFTFSNWGTLTVTHIDADNQFNGFNFMLDVSNSYHATYSHSSTVTLHPQTLTTVSDLEVGFTIAASTIKSSTVPWQVIMRGVKVDGMDYEYNGNFDVNGSALSISSYGELTLVNFSVDARNAANAIQVDAGGMLHIFNGIFDDATHQWIGGSNAVIRSDGNANGVMLYGTMEMFNGAITECVNGIVAADTAGVLCVINSTIAGNSGWGIISSITAPPSDKHNFIVADSTVAYNGQGGIQVNNGGELVLLNAIILNKNPNGSSENDKSVDVVLNDGSKIFSESGGYIYGANAKDTIEQMIANFGSTSLVWTGPEMYTISLVENSPAWNKSVAWGYELTDSSSSSTTTDTTSTDTTTTDTTSTDTTSTDTTSTDTTATETDSGTDTNTSSNSDVTSGLFFKTIVFGEGATYSITFDKMGNPRTDPGGRIGSYVLSGSIQPTTSILVTTLQDSEDIIGSGSSKLYSLRYVINYLLGEENTEADTIIAFDWAKLAEEAGSNALTITLDPLLGSLNAVFVDGTTSITALAIDLSVSGHEIPAGYTLNINGSALTKSVFTVSGIALTVTGANALTVTGSSSTADNGAAFNLANAAGTSLTLKDVTVTGGNTAGYGGAVYVSGSNASLTATGTTFSNNSAAAGGAIYNNGGTVSVSGTLSGNTAATAGGAIYNNGGTVSVSGTLSGNTAAAAGGAVYNYAGIVDIMGNVTGNSAVNGAGVYNSGNLTVIGDLSSNIASGVGGGLYNTGIADITGNVDGNSAVDGAGIYSVSGSVVMTGDLTGNMASNEGAAAFIGGGSFNLVGDIAGNTGNSIFYTTGGGLVQIGDLDHYITVKDNSGVLVMNAAGDVLIVNASIRDNDPGTASLFDISSGVFTLLNSTVTGNTGDILDQTGGTVQIADSTIAYNLSDNITVAGGNLYVLNSIVNASNDFSASVTNSVSSLINEDVTTIFKLKNGNPVEGENGTLVIKLAGAAGLGGVMVGFTRDSGVTDVYYTGDGSTWYQADGTSAGSVTGISVVEKGQNSAVRLYDGYGKLSIGAYSLNGGDISLVVTISGDTSMPGETTLREALENAEYLYKDTGEVQTVTFKVDEVDLDSTITITSPVTVDGKGKVTIKADTPFTGDSVFIVDAGSSNTVSFTGVTIRGKSGVRGIEVDSGDLSLNHVTIENGFGDDTVPTKPGGAIYVTGGGDVTGSNVVLKDNFGTDGAAIYTNGSVSLGNFTISDNYVGNSDPSKKGSVIKMTDPGSELLLENGTITGNGATAALISTQGTAKLVSVSAYDNGLWSSLLRADSADVVNSTLTGDPANNGALVRVINDLNAVNSIMVTSRKDGPAALAGDIRSAYSIYSGYLENVSVDVDNLIGVRYGDLFDEGATPPVAREDSPAAIGVWTGYDSQTREITYTERPEDIWTKGYKPDRMQWHVLGGGLTSFNGTYLVQGNSSMPSVGGSWIRSGRNHPDFGPGVDTTKIDPTYNGGFGDDWGYSSVVDSYLMNPAARLSDETESGMGWYSSMLSELFGFRTPQTSILSVTGGIPADELGLSVDADTEDFGEFQEAPYRADDGTPLSQEELNAIRNAAVSGRLPADSVHLDEAVHAKVANSLRSSELFKDSFDKALDALLGLDA